MGSGGVSETISGNCQFPQIVSFVFYWIILCTTTSYCSFKLEDDTHHTKRDSPHTIATSPKATNSSSKETFEADKRSEGTSSEENRCYREVERSKNSAKYCNKQTRSWTNPTKSPK